MTIIKTEPTERPWYVDIEQGTGNVFIMSGPEIVIAVLCTDGYEDNPNPVDVANAHFIVDCANARQHLK